ncbi:cytochrome c oxidase subunit II [Nakamurella silvestris]|nr:cytochrome c oxidase subunit II [Nakamurella silvestris]
MASLPRFGWPEGKTLQGERMQWFWSATFIAALVVGVLVWGLMFWSFAVYRKRKGSPLYPKQTKENLPLELVYTAIPLVMVAVLFYFTVTTENYVLKRKENPDVTVAVTAFKWNWDFAYEGSKNAEGEEVHTVGTTDEIPLLVLPVGKTIEYHLQSKDVIHSFWVPDFLFKRDVFPFPDANQVDNGDKFQNEITEAGAMVGRCAELCGQYHSMMQFEVRALPADLFAQYMDLRQTKNPATGVSYTAAAALTEMNCGELCAPQATTTYPMDTKRESKSEILREGGAN